MQPSQPVPHTTSSKSTLNAEAPVFTPAKSAKIATIAERRKGPKLTGKVENVSVEFLVDTGAESTVLSRRCFETLPRSIKAKFQDNTSSVYVADGTKVWSKGPVLCNIVVGERSIYDVVFVADIEDYALLGWDAQQALGVEFKVAGVNLAEQPRIRRVTKPVIRRITVTEDHILPARSEILISGTIDGGPLKGAALVSSTEDIQHTGIVVARTVTKGDEHQCQLRVLNPADEPRHLKAGTIIAEAEAVDVLNTPSTETSPIPPQVDLPDYLVEMYERAVNEGQLSTEVAQQLKELLIRNIDVFAKNDNDLGRTSLVQHDIITNDAAPIRQPPRRIPIGQQEEFDKEIASMLEKGAIEPGQSPWASPVVLVRKKDGSLRFCIDYRKLNQVTQFDAYPLPRVDETLEAVGGSKFFTTLDLLSGYWQVGLTPEARLKSAFCVRSGLYLWNVMPFGLCNAPSTFERLMETVLQGLQWRTCLVYLDDIVIFARNEREHLQRMEEVFQRLIRAGLKLKPRKCRLFHREAEYLGHIVSEDGLKVSPGKVAAVQEWPQPECVTELRSFLGTAGYYRRFVKNFSTIAAPLHELTKKGVEFNWTPECQRAFEQLKKCLATTPVLNFPVPGATYILDTDASERGIGAVLSQLIPTEPASDGTPQFEERVLGYASRTLSVHERNDCTTRKELLAVVWYLRHFRPYLYGTEFLVRSDHSSLQWIFNFWEPEGQLARWLQVLGEYKFRVIHRPGNKHLNADGLSRQGPCRQCKREYDIPTTETTLPCPELAEDIIITRRTVTNICTVTLTPEWTANQLAVWQETDEDLNPIVSALKEGRQPTAAESSGYSAASKRYLMEWERLKLRGGVAYRIWFNNKGEEESYQLLTPRCIRATILHAAHDGDTAGHFANKKTLAKIRQHFFWHGLAMDTRDYCRSCMVCQQRKPLPNRPHHPLQQESVGEPLQRVTIDILGFEKTSTRGNKYVLVIVDTLTKWAEALPMPDEKAETVARLLVEEFVCRFGIPAQLHSDQGRQFEAAVFQEMCQLLGIHKTRTTPLHPQSNGQTERLNRTLLDLLAKLAAENPSEWDVKLPYAISAYRSTPHNTTGETPNRLMLGREVTTPLLLLTPPPPEMQDRSPWVETLHEHFQEAHRNILNHYGRALHTQKTYYDRRQRGFEFSVGDHVWLAVKKMRKRGPYKLNPQRWEGPYDIRKRLSATVYVIGRLGQKATQVVNVARLTPVIQRRADLLVPAEPVVPELTTLKTDEPEEVQVEQTSEETWDLGPKSQIPEAVSPPSRAPVGFMSELPPAPHSSRPTRQRRQPQRYGEVRRLSDYEDFE